MYKKSTMTSVSMQNPILIVIGFGFPFESCTSHPIPKASLAQGGWVLSKFKPSQVPRQFAFVGVRVAMAVCCAMQHATPHSTAQYPCALQHNASQVQHIPSVVLAALGGQLCRDIFCITLVQNSNLGLINYIVIFKVR